MMLQMLHHSMHDACAAAVSGVPVDFHRKGLHQCAAGSSSRPRTLQGSNAHRLNQRSNPAKLAADQHQPPECFITPANSVTKKLPQLLPQGALRLPHIQSHTSHASPRTRAEARNPKSKHSHADNAENHSLGQLQSPASVPSGGRTAQQRRKQKRPQWQDVSIDLSAMQDAQEQAGPLMNHADRPIGPIPSTETARAVHMSGVSPASPSPPKQHPQNMPLASHKSHSSVPTLPALALPGACPAPALAAWHENIELNQPRQHSQQYPHQLSQSVGTARDTLPMPSRTSQQPQSRQLPNCLPPLHHQPLRRAGHPAPSSADCASSQSLYGTQISKYQLTPFPCDREGQHTDPLSSSHHALQTYNDAVPSTWYRRAEGPDGFASDPSRQVASEDPRTAQQVPMQYLRHPCGSGAPGGLHRLHRPLRPVARSQHQPANSFLDGGASTSAGVGLTSAGAGTTSACATSTLTEAPLQSLQQEAAASAAPDSMRHPWQSQTSHHEQHRPASGRQSQPVVVQQQPTFPVPAVPNCGWQPYNVTEQQPQQEGMPVRTPCHDIGSSAGQAAEDVQDVHKRLQQVNYRCICNTVPTTSSMQSTHLQAICHIF